MELSAKRKGSGFGVEFPDGKVYAGHPHIVPAPYASMSLREADKLDSLMTKHGKKLTVVKIRTFYSTYLHVVASRRDYNGKLLSVIAAHSISTNFGKSPSYYSGILREMCDMGLLKKEGYTRHVGTTYSFPLC